MTLNETLKSLGLPENPTKDQILKILSDSNLKQLESLLSDPAMGDELKEKIKGALGEYADLSQGPQPRRIERVGDGVMKDAHTSPDNEGPGDSQIEKLDATQAALQLPNDPNITRFTIFDPRNTCRSAQEVAEIHKATGLEILPKGNVLDPENGNIGVELISFRPQRIAQQLTIAAVNMQAQINEENFPTTVDNILKNYIAKEMETVTPQIEAIRSGIASNVQMALRALNQAPDMDLSGTSETVKKVKAAKDLVQGRINAEEYQPTSQEAVDNAISSYVTDLIYNDSSEVFNLIGKAVDRGMQQALEAKAYKPLPVGPNSERVAIVVAGGPASGKTKASSFRNAAMSASCRSI